MASPPLYLTPVVQSEVARGDGPLVDQFIEQFCRITKESLGGSAGELLRLRDWQKTTTGMIYARRPDGRLRHRQALIGLPRKNGKSALGSSYGVHGLIMSPPGAEVYSCAADKEQARIVFGVAKRMVELDEQLSGEIKVYRDALEYTSNGSIYKVLSSEAFTKEGLNPTTIIYDELHAAPNDELYDVMALAQGARRDPLMIIITTAGVKIDQTGHESICYRLYQHGVQVAKGLEEDPTFFMAWWGAPENADYKDPEVWRAANPGFDDLIDPEDFKAALSRVSENQFRTKRLNQWVSSVEAWLPQGAWEACYDDSDLVVGNRGVVLGFDGSRDHDTTALVLSTVDQNPTVRVLRTWERPLGHEGDGWKVPRAQVMDAIRQACRDNYVREIAFDEYLWQTEAETLTEEGLPVVVFPQNDTRMTPATQRFYELVTTKRIRHDGNKILARHLDNCQLKHTYRGSRLVKDAGKSSRKIDVAVATVMAVDRAVFWATQAGPESYIWKDYEGTEHSKPIKDIGFVW